MRLAVLTLLLTLGGCASAPPAPIETPRVVSLNGVALSVPEGWRVVREEAGEAARVLIEPDSVLAEAVGEVSALVTAGPSREGRSLAEVGETVAETYDLFPVDPDWTSLTIEGRAGIVRAYNVIRTPAQDRAGVLVLDAGTATAILLLTMDGLADTGGGQADLYALAEEIARGIAPGSER